MLGIDLSINEHEIVEKILYRLIKKHIAGTTMSSAIEKAKELNRRKLGVSITFLSDSAKDSSKARYATTTYLELIRRIARMGLMASIHVPLVQVGYGISPDVLEKNVNDIVCTANKYGVFVWLEQPCDYKLPQFLLGAKGVGYVRPVSDANDYLNINKGRIRAMKILCGAGTEGAKGKSVSDRIKLIAKSTNSIVLQSPEERTVKEFLANGYKKSVVFEFQLGYSSSAIARIVKKGAGASIYVPFGKDWAPYAINKVPERYARFLAEKLLNRNVEGGA
jgi:proline dehydrogenase